MEKAVDVAPLSAGVTATLLSASESNALTFDGQLSHSAATCPPTSSGRLAASYKPRFTGPRWQIRYGSYGGVETFAVDELQRMVQRYLPYVVEVKIALESTAPPDHSLLVGTPANNPLIAAVLDRASITLSKQPGSYVCASVASPWHSQFKCVVIAANDAAGVLHGVMHFNKKLSGLGSNGEQPKQQTLDAIGTFIDLEAPAIENRDVWTWGYVIYDGHRFIDNMARLRMNRLLFWNDVPPLNCRAIIDHAHSRGIKVVLGFPWGWGMDQLDPNSASDRELIKSDVLCRVDEMHGLGMDAIYFQTFTGTKKQEAGGKPIAALARDWANDIGGAILQRYPGLRIEWGLHATSIMENYRLLETLDPRVVIVWEDAGVIPYSYDPVTHSTTGKVSGSLNNPQATLDYSRKLATFRPGSEFAMVAKGWTTLGWSNEFEHHQQFMLGEREASFIRQRLKVRQPRWDEVNRLWLQNYPIAARFYQEILATSPHGMTVLGLIEDGLFEDKGSVQCGSSCGNAVEPPP